MIESNLNQHKPAQTSTNFFILAIALIAVPLLILITGCNEKVIEPSNTSPQLNVKSQKINFSNKNFNYSEINNALEKIALSLAKSMNDKELRKSVKEEVSKKFDGSYEVLYKNIKDHNLSNGSSVRRKITEGYIASKNMKKENIDNREAENEIEVLSSQIPKFQISVPVNFEKWDAENYKPLITFRPVGIKLKDLKQVKAYDEDGNLHILDATKKPDQPVIVLGVNKRIYEDGTLKVRPMNGGDSIPGGGGSNTYYRLLLSCDLSGVPSSLWDDGNSWLEGDPEFYIDLWAGGLYQRTYLNVTNSNAILITLQNSFSSIAFALAEEDGGLLGSDDQLCGSTGMSISYGSTSFDYSSYTTLYFYYYTFTE